MNFIHNYDSNCLTGLLDEGERLRISPDEFKETIKPILCGLLLEGVPEVLSFDYPNPTSLLQDTYLTDKVGDEIGEYLNFYVDKKRVLYLSKVHILRRKYCLLNYLNSLVPWDLDNPMVFIGDDPSTFETRALLPVIPFLAEFYDGMDFSPHIVSSVRSFREAFLETEFGATIANKADPKKVIQWVDKYKSRLIPYIKEYRAQIYVEAYQLFSKNKREGMNAYALRRQNIIDSFGTLLVMINSAIDKMVDELANSTELMHCKKLIAELQNGVQNSLSLEEIRQKESATRYLTECKEQRDNPPMGSLPQLMKSFSEEAKHCWMVLDKKGFFSLPKTMNLENVKRSRLIQECMRRGVPFTVALMSYLEYPQHFTNDLGLSKEKYYDHISYAFGLKSSDNVKKNCLSLTDEKYHNYKAWEKVDEAKNYYEEISK